MKKKQNKKAIRKTAKPAKTTQLAKPTKTAKAANPVNPAKPATAAKKLAATYGIVCPEGQTPTLVNTPNGQVWVCR